MNQSATKKWVTVMGSFVADLAFRTDRVPAWGEALMGQSFKLGPGGYSGFDSAPYRNVDAKGHFSQENSTSHEFQMAALESKPL
jgi:hypothetical protein